MVGVAIVGVLSLALILNGQRRFGNFGGLAHFPLIWLAGFTIYPGYIYALITFPCRGTPNGSLFEAAVLNPGESFFLGLIAMAMATYYALTLYFAFRRRRNWIKPLASFYVFSVAINFFNYIFVVLLSL